MSVPALSDFDHHVVDVVDHIGIVAEAAAHAVGAHAAVEDVVPGVTDDRVVEVVAGAVDVSGARQAQALDIGRQRVADSRNHEIVDTFVGVFDYHVAGIVDDVVIVAGAADHRVGAAKATEVVIAAVAGDRIVEIVAIAADGAAGQGQVLDVNAEPVVDRRLHRVGARVEGFRHHVVDIIDNIGVVAEAAGHGVSTGAAVERVVAAVAGDDVGIAIAGAVDVGAAGQGQVVDIGAERVADRRLHHVGAFAESLGDRIADIIDDVGVIAEAAGHGVSAGAAVEGVVAAVAGDDVGIAVAGAVDVGAAGQGQVVDIGAERIAERRLHQCRCLR